MSSDLALIKKTAQEIYSWMNPSPQISWPLLNQRTGCELWLKHENHNPTGSFKVRGGMNYLSKLKERSPNVTGVIAATRGNFGQSVAFACKRLKIKAVIVVPEGNNPDKNRAMIALGAEVIVRGKDFDESVTYASLLAEERQLHLMPSFHWDLVTGVATYAFELFTSTPNLDRIYVPIGLGSGICAVVKVRDLLGLATEVIGVVAENAPTYKLSFTAGELKPTSSADTMADGLAVRNPNQDALDIMLNGVERIVSVTEDELQCAVRVLFEDTHNLAEGAGAAAVAAVLQEGYLNSNLQVGAVLTGGNISKAILIDALGSA